MNRLISERIIRIEETELTSEDKQLLKNKLIRLAAIYIPPYFVLVGIGIWKWMEGVPGLNTGRRVHQQISFDEKDEINFSIVAPYFFIGLIVLATIYFVYIYLKYVHPLIKDIRRQKKHLLFYRPVKSEMAYFNKYFISTPLFKLQQIEVSHEDFSIINDHDELCIEIGPRSIEILRLRIGEYEIKYSW